jgi:rubrerythrin
MKRFAELNEQEILALAISNEDEDSRIYRSFADTLRPSYPDTAEMYDKMAIEEIGHRDMLLELHRKKFGDFLPLIRRQDVKGFVTRRPIWLNRTLSLDAARKFAEEMEYETARFYRRSADSAKDDAVSTLLRRLAAAEDKHEALAHELGRQISPQARATEDDTARRMFMLQYVQPGLAGLMDGSVSTLAPLFAAAFATHDTWSTFLVGLAASIGAGISMAFAEALSDDGSLTGRGAPLVLGHALPFLIPHFYVATGIAFAVVAVELAAISWIRMRYMDTPFLQAAFQVVVGGALVFAAGILIGNS